MRYEWSQEYSVGVSKFDNQHKRWFELVNDLGDAIDSEDTEQINKVFDAVYDYTQVHFQAEESMMREAGYPNYQAHKNLHDGFIEQFETLRNVDNNGKPMIQRQLLEIMVSWLKTHIQMVDMQYTDFFNKAGYQ